MITDLSVPKQKIKFIPPTSTVDSLTPYHISHYSWCVVNVSNSVTLSDDAVCPLIRLNMWIMGYVLNLITKER